MLGASFEVYCAGISIRLFRPSLEAMGGWLDSLNGDPEDDEQGEAELQTWVNPWDSGLFVHMRRRPQHRLVASFL